MSRELAARGHLCSVLTLDLGITEQLRKDLSHSTLIVLPCLWSRFYLPSPKINLISEAIQNADVIHLMGHWTIINAIAYFFIRKFHKKYVVCPAGALPIFGRSRIIKKTYNFFVGAQLIRNANAHIAIAISELAQYKEYGVSPAQVSLVPNGITPIKPNPAVLNIRDQLKISNSPFILFVGRLNLIKGPDLLIEAFSLLKDQFPNHQLVLAGPDEGLKASLSLRIRALGIENRVHFVGYVGGTSKSELLIQADLMVIPSRQEAMSIVVLEAGLANTPVVLTDQCGLNELQEINAATVVKVSVLDIANGIQTSLTNREASLMAANNLKSHIKKNYLWAMIALKLEILFNSVLEE